MLGSVITISTMTAAALGNTLSDVLSIGSTLYVEKLVAKCGLKKPDLTHNQLNLDSSRFAANVVRSKYFLIIFTFSNFIRNSCICVQNLLIEFISKLLMKTIWNRAVLLELPLVVSLECFHYFLSNFCFLPFYSVGQLIY